MGKRNCIPSAKYLHEILEYKNGKLYWKKIIAKCIKIGNEVGTNNGKDYLIIPIEYKHYYAHRIIYMMHHNYVPYIVDHIDGNKLNNKIENLRPANNSQNAANQKLPKNNKSTQKNVFWNKSKEKWQVAISVNNKLKHIGTFLDFEIAKKAAYDARIKYHGEYANHE